MEIGNEIREDVVKTLRRENFHLKNQLHNKNKQVKNLKRTIKKMKEQAPAKQHFKNAPKQQKHRR